MTKPKKINVRYIDSKVTKKVVDVDIKKKQQEKADDEGCAFC